MCTLYHSIAQGGVDSGSRPCHESFLLLLLTIQQARGHQPEQANKVTKHHFTAARHKDRYSVTAPPGEKAAVSVIWVISAFVALRMLSDVEPRISPQSLRIWEMYGAGCVVMSQIVFPWTAARKPIAVK
ncbi:hypothetical protein C8J57DRAFT_1258759 [Mycena rebaudengoi]|nr:hypothetical protein C8J57DRAFT_1258759 [Mycena rebaudengoi]